MRSFKTCFVLLVWFFCMPGSAAYADGEKSAGALAKPAAADPAKPAPPAATREEVEELRREVGELKATIQRLVEANLQQAAGAPRLVQVSAVQPADAQGDKQAGQKKEQPQELKFSVGGGEVQLYGHADVSFDYVDNGLSNRIGAVGNNGWLSQFSSNLSNFGIRGSRRLTPYLTGVFQVETEINYSATPGPTSDAQVKQGIGSRDTYVGVQGNWGAVKYGKTDAPYKKSVARMDPFINSIGDSRSIMGNSGGDNRAEFKTRVPHALWYESPKIKGFNANVLFSPGQNRSTDNTIKARSEPNCTGGNDPPCNDGGFSNLLSAALSYTNGPLYVIAAYERHGKVNRTADEGSSADPNIPPPGSVGIADEGAFEVGVQYTLKPTRTTVSFLYEKLKRYAPAAPAFNERSRPNATWLAFVQKVTSTDDFNFGWGHAGKTPGDPGGQFNQPGPPPPSFLGIAGPIDNRTNLYDVGFKHHFSDKRTTAYFVFAMQKNHQGAHYDLGANGHGAVVDRQDAAGNSFTGLTHKGVSVGLTYDF